MIVKLKDLENAGVIFKVSEPPSWALKDSQLGSERLLGWLSILTILQQFYKCIYKI